MDADLENRRGAEAQSDKREVWAWWRALIRPIFFAMYDKGIGELHIKREGTKVKFTLTPEEDKPIQSCDAQSSPRATL
jgi:hypothetical protein